MIRQFYMSDLGFQRTSEWTSTVHCRNWLNDYRLNLDSRIIFNFQAPQLKNIISIDDVVWIVFMVRIEFQRRKAAVVGRSLDSIIIWVTDDSHYTNDYEYNTTDYLHLWRPKNILCYLKCVCHATCTPHCHWLLKYHFPQNILPVPTTDYQWSN